MVTGSQNYSRLGAYAGFVSRLTAWILDHLIISLVFFLSGWIADFVLNSFPFQGDIYNLLIVAILLLFDLSFYLFYFIGLWMISGQTPGKTIMGLRIVRADGERLKLRNAIIRFVGYWVSAALLFIGYLLVLFDNRRQALHDKLGGTIVVYSETWEEKAEKNLYIQELLEAQRRAKFSRPAEQGEQ